MSNKSKPKNAGIAKKAGEQVEEGNKELRSFARKKPQSKPSAQKNMVDLLRMPGAAEIDFDPPRLDKLHEPADFSKNM